MNIKKYIPLNLKNKIIYLKSNDKEYIEIKKEDKKIIIALAANYGNLGDVAITYAQKQFLEEFFSEYKIIEIPIDKTYTNMKSIKKIINNNDIITIIGGGNFGNIYKDIEKARQFYIKKFPNNRIVCFPQTIDFSTDRNGNKELKIAQRVYGRHKDLTLFAREEKSYNIMKKLFKNNSVYLTPDIVLSLNKEKPKMERKKITTCFRNDKENKVSLEEKNIIIKKLKDIYRDNVIVTDTHVGDVKIGEDEREKYLERIWKTFRESKIVLTDRLHGMIFCAITGTPCIAFQNSNGKIEATYKKWLQKFSYIQLKQEGFSIEEQINKILSDNKKNNTVGNLNDFKKIIEVIKNE